DRPVEARNAELALIAVEEMHLLGAGEDPVRAAHLAVRRHRLEGAGVIGLIDLAVALAVEAYLGYDLLLLRRDEGGEPEFVGEAEPAADAGVPDRRLLHIGVVVPVGLREPAAVMQDAVQHGDRAF